MPILTEFRDRCASQLIPLQSTLELTYRCNERCGHCYLTTYNDHENGQIPLALDEWKRVIDQLADAKSFYLVLIGGEAMLHPNFWEIAEHGARRGFLLSLITNGLLVDERAAWRLSDLGFYNVTLSIYSLQDEIHDAMTRRKGSLKRALAALDVLRARGVMVGINCLLTRSNIDHAFELQDWAAARGVHVGFDPLVTPKSDGDLAPTVERATREQLFRFYREQKARGRGPEPVDPGAPDDPACNQGRGKCAVDAHGNLLTCLEIREPIGNLRDASFAELWDSEQAWKLRSPKVSDLKFDAACGDGSFCDHCPGTALAETGDKLQASPFQWEVAGIKRQVFAEPAPV